MFLEISDQKTIGTLKQEFAFHFPYLKIVFFPAPEETGDIIHGRLFPQNRTVGAVRYRHNNGAMEIHPLQTAWHIEKCFRERFGLHVMIYRRTQKGWTLAPGNRDLTLKEHNDLGRAVAEAPPGGPQPEELLNKK